MADTTQPRKKRQKATTELGRQLMQKERQRLAKEQAELGEKLANEAKVARELKFRTPRTAKAPKQQILLNRSIVRRVAAVLASERVVVPIKAEAAAKDKQMSAWTDFDQISVKFTQHEDVRLLAATLRALLYHEGGHCRWTVPFNDLVDMVRRELGTVPTPGHITHTRLHKAWNCLEDQRMETAVVSDSPRKASYFTPMLMTEHMKTLDYMAANYPLLVWRRYLPTRLVNEARRLFVVRHGAQGDQLVRDLDRVVTKYVTATKPVVMWEAVCEYHELLEDMKPLATNMDDAGHSHQQARQIEDDFDGLTIPIDPSMLPEPNEDEDEQTPDVGGSPESSDDLSEEEIEHLIEVLIAAWNAPETLVAIRYVLNQQDEQDEQESGSESSPGDLGDEDESEGQEGTDGDREESGDEDAASDEDVDGAGRPGPSDDEADDSSAEDDHGGGQDHEEGGEDDDEEHDEGGSSGSHTDDGSDLDDDDAPLTQDDLDEMIEEAEQERYNQGELDGDVEAFRDAQENMASSLDPYVGGISSNTDAIIEAEVLARQIEDSFHAHTMDRAPAWVEQQRRGVLNVGRYMTRTAGDTEFFRQWTEDDAPGFDIAVSVLLDYSISMSSETERLAQVGYACKLACQKLDIPCTVTLWDTDARTLWDANETIDNMPVISCNGGTVPDIALADLDNQRCDKSKHLVLIMTDGQWQGGWSDGKRHLAFYKDPGRSMIGFGYGAEYLAAGLLGKGCDEAFAITDLMDIPRFLEQALLDLA